MEAVPIVDAVKVDDVVDPMTGEGGGIKADVLPDVIVNDKHPNQAVVVDAFKQPKKKRVRKSQDDGMHSGFYDAVVIQPVMDLAAPPIAHLPSVVTWWVPRTLGHWGNRSRSKKHRQDNRVGNPGIGSRGSDKRIPRNPAFKLQVVENYSINLNLKKDGKLDDPCLATARQFGINKSQVSMPTISSLYKVSKWYNSRQQIEEKVQASSALGGTSMDKQKGRPM